MYLDALTYLMELGQFQTGKEKVLETRSKILVGNLVNNEVKDISMC